MRSSSEIVNSLQHWDKLKTNTLDSFNEALDIYKEMYISKQNYSEYPKKIVGGIIRSIVEEGKLTEKEIKSSIQNKGFDESSSNYFLETVDLYTSICRVENNHKIISKRFNIEKIFKGKSKKDIELLFNTTPIGIYLICRYIHTYNLSIQDEINLAVEECAYLMNKYHAFYMNKYSVYYIIKAVFIYVFGEYPSNGIPEDIVEKVKNASFDKLNKSVFLHSLLGYDYYSIDLDKEIIWKNDINYLNTFIYNKDYTGDGVICSTVGDRLFHSIIISDIFYYKCFIENYETNEEMISNFKNWLNKILNIKVTISFIDNIKYLNILQSIFNRIRFILKDESFISRIDIYMNIIHDCIIKQKEMNEYYCAYEYAKKNPLGIDPSDEAYGYEGISDYDKMVYRKFCEAYATYLGCIIDEDVFKNTFANPVVIIKENNDLIKDVADIAIKYPYSFNIPQLQDSYKKAYDLLKEDAMTNDIAMHKLNVISTSLMTLNNFKLSEYKDPNQDDMKSDDFYSGNFKSISAFVDDNKKAMAELVESVSILNTYGKKILESTNSSIITEDTVISEYGLKILNEMKLSSYASLALDKIRAVYNKLNDKQKSAFMTIDRIADSIEDYDNKEAKADARYRIVKGKMLPSLSRCLKSSLEIGFLGAFNIYLGILALISKYVSSKNAMKEERQAVADELEVEIEMIDHRIRDAEDEKNYKKERRMRLLKKKMLTQYARIKVDNATKWNNGIVMKQDADRAGLKFGLSINT